MNIPSKTPAKNKILILILISIISTIVYWNSLGNGFHLDDKNHIVNNIYIRSLKNIPLFFTDTNTFSVVETNHYRPLLLVSHAINYAAGALDPTGFHIGNLILHAGTSFLIFLIVLDIGGPGYFFTAASAALIFAVHPFNSEAINYITARSSIMSGFFYLLTFWCWVNYRKSSVSSKQLTDKTAEGSHPASAFSLQPSVFSLQPSAYYIFSLLAFIAGMLTKEVVITLPLMLLLYDIYGFSQVSREQEAGKSVHCSLFTVHYFLRWRTYISYIPFLLITASYIKIRGYLTRDISPFLEPARGYFENFLIETKVLIKYIYLLFFPVNLSLEHAILEVSSILDWKVLTSLLLLSALVIHGILLFRSREFDRRVVSFFIFWFFITMIPTTIIPLNAPLQENRGYIAAVGFTIILAVAINRFRQMNRNNIRSKTIALLLLISLYSLLTINRNTFWKDDLTLWTDAVAKAPASWRAHSSLGYVYEQLNLGTQAIHEYEKAVKIKNDYYMAIHRIGVVLLEKGELELALDKFKDATVIEPFYAEGHLYQAKVYLKLGQIDNARNACQQVLNIGTTGTRVNERITEQARTCLKWVRIKE